MQLEVWLPLVQHDIKHWNVETASWPKTDLNKKSEY